MDPNAPHPDDIVIDMHTGDVAMCHKDFAPLVRPRTSLLGQGRCGDGFGRSTRLFVNSGAPTAALRRLH